MTMPPVAPNTSAPKNVLMMYRHSEQLTVVLRQLNIAIILGMLRKATFEDALTVKVDKGFTFKLVLR